MSQLLLNLERFKNSIPLKPYATDNLLYGVKIQKKEKAILKQYLSLNHRYYLKWLVFDVDLPASVVEYNYSMVGVPAPNLIIENPQNGHAHFLYELSDEVYLSNSAHDRPIRYAHAVYCSLRDKLGADIGYTGLITKNALHANWSVYSYYSKPYSLHELSSKLEIAHHQIKKPILLSEAIYLGRNCKIFDDVRCWAYIEIRKYRSKSYIQWFNTVLEQCITVNSTFTIPLSYNEVKAIAKSISKWIWKRDGYAYQEFIDRQTRKSKLGASKGGKARSDKYKDKRDEIYNLKAKGMSNTQIAKKLSVARQTVINWLKV